MILITGGAGFIGSNLSKYFVRNDEEVRILDNFSTGSIDNIKEIEQEIDIVKGSIGNAKIVKKSLKGVEVVIHNAAFMGVRRTGENPWAVLEQNNHNNHVFFKEILNSEVKKLIFASSSEVYGEPVKIPEVEDQPLNCSTPYSVSKKLSEIYCQVLYEKYGIDTCSFRYFNIYGPNQDSTPYGFVTLIFLRRALKNKTLVIFGDGTQTRDFTYIDDAIEANILAIKNKMRGKVLNIGSGIETSINNLAEIVIKVSRRNVKIIHDKERRGEIRRRCADINKAKNLLNWKTKIDLETGLKKTWEWMLNENSKRKNYK